MKFAKNVLVLFVLMLLPVTRAMATERYVLQTNQQGVITKLGGDLDFETWPEDIIVEFATDADSIFFDGDVLNRDLIILSRDTKFVLSSDSKLVFRNIVLEINGDNQSSVVFQRDTGKWKGILFTGDDFSAEVTNWVMHGFTIENVGSRLSAGLDFHFSYDGLNHPLIELSDFSFYGIPDEQEADGIIMAAPGTEYILETVAATDANCCILITELADQGLPCHNMSWENLQLTDSNIGICRVNGVPGGSIRLGEIILEDGRISGMKFDGINMGNNLRLGNLKLLNTIIEDCGRYGIKVGGTGSTSSLFSLYLEDETEITGCVADGIYMAGVDHDLIIRDSVHIHLNQINGICVNGESHRIIADQSWIGSIDYNHQHGLFVQGHNNTVYILNGEFKYNLGDGLHVEGDADDIILQNSTFSDNRTNGVYFSNGPEQDSPELHYRIVFDNTIMNNNGYNGCMVTVNSSHAANPDFDYVWLYAGNEAQFNSNHTHGFWAYGTRLIKGHYYFGAPLVIDTKLVQVNLEDGCHFDQNSHNGCFVQGAENTASSRSCTFNANNNAGILVRRQNYPDASLRGVHWISRSSEANNNRRHGMYVERAIDMGTGDDLNDTECYSCFFNENIQDGIKILDQGTNIRHFYSNCEIGHNHGPGVYLQGAASDNVWLYKCYIHYNHGSGVEADSACSDLYLRVTRCRISLNMRHGINISESEEAWRWLFIDNNIITSNCRSGIHCMLAELSPLYDSKIQGNLIEYNTWQGYRGLDESCSIYLENTPVLLVANNLLLDSFFGVRLVKPSGQVSISNNIVSFENDDYIAGLSFDVRNSQAQPVVKHYTFDTNVLSTVPGASAVLVEGNVPPQLDLLVIDLPDGGCAVCNASMVRVNLYDSVVYPSGNRFLGDVNPARVIFEDPLLYNMNMPATILDPQVNEALEYHLMYNSPAINIIDPFTPGTGDPQKYGLEDPPDAGAFGGHLAVKWPKYVGRNDNRIDYPGFSIGPYTFLSPQCVRSDVIHFKPDTYYFPTDMVYIPDEMAEIPGGVEFCFSKNVNEPSTVSSLTINRNVEAAGVGPGSPQVIMYSTDFNESTSQAWAGLNILDTPSVALLPCNYQNGLMIRDAIAGLTLDGGDVVANNMLVERCGNGVLLNDASTEIDHPRLTVNNSEYRYITNACVILTGDVSPSYVSNHTHYENATFGVKSEGLYTSGYFESNHSTYTNFSDTGIFLGSTEVKIDGGEVSNCGKTGLLLYDNSSIDNHIRNGFSIANCGTTLVDDQNEGFIGGLVVDNFSADIRNTSFQDNYGTHVATIRDCTGQHTYIPTFIDVDFYLPAGEINPNKYYIDTDPYRSTYPSYFFVDSYTTPTVNNSRFHCTEGMNRRIGRAAHFISETHLDFTGNDYVGLTQSLDDIEDEYFFEGRRVEFDLYIPLGDGSYSDELVTRSEERSLSSVGQSGDVDVKTTPYLTVGAMMHSLEKVAVKDGVEAAVALSQQYRENCTEESLANDLRLMVPMLYLASGIENGARKAYQEYETMKASAECRADYLICAMQQVKLEGALKNMAERSSSMERLARYSKLRDELRKVQKQGQEQEEFLPTCYDLRPAYPNPFNAMSRIVFDLPQKSHVSLIVYDVLGREVVSLVDRDLKAGRHETIFEASKMASGVYFVRMKADSYTKSQKLLLLK